MDFNDRILIEGKPFYVKIETGADALDKTVYLDSTTFDPNYTTDIYENKMFFVTALKVTPGSGETIEYLKFDGEDDGTGTVWGNDSANADVGINLTGEYDSTLTVVMPSVIDKYGQPLIVRNQVSLKNTSDQGTTASTVELWGVYTDRNM